MIQMKVIPCPETYKYEWNILWRDHLFMRIALLGRSNEQSFVEIIVYHHCKNWHHVLISRSFKFLSFNVALVSSRKRTFKENLTFEAHESIENVITFKETRGWMEEIGELVIIFWFELCVFKLIWSKLKSNFYKTNFIILTNSAIN